MFFPSYSSLISPLTLGIHELGHLALSFFGEFFGILGGTLFQVLAPILGLINFYRQEDFFALILCFGWLSTSLFDMAKYVADARAMNLPLVSPFGSDNVIHDWNYLFTRMGLLENDASIAFIVKCLATAAMLICLMGGFWLLWQMKKSSRQVSVN